jgi:AcrR family transcriptional regulator
VALSTTNASSSETRRRLVEAGTQLFAELGFRAVSVRDLAKKADVNSALINYHFGSKEGLFEEVIRASAAQHVAERMHQLTKAKRSKRTLTLEEILRIYLEPLVEAKTWEAQKNSFSKLHATLLNEPSEVVEEIADRAFNSVNIAFIDEIAECLPHLDRDVVIWRFYAMIGSLLFFGTRQGPPGLESVSGGRLKGSDPRQVYQQILPYLLAGFAAPMPV